jgi:hypothetical protein
MKRREPMLVDQKSADLAEHFLADIPGHTPEDETELAEAIQQVCENFCTALENELNGPS